MNHRISAGMFVRHQGRVLMVRHTREGRYDFWVAPGGGVKGTESLQDAAEREVREETGLNAKAGRMLYIEEMHQPGMRHCKFWFLGELIGGELDASGPDAAAEYITQAAWRSRDELAAETLPVFPQVLAERFWLDIEAGSALPQHLPLREMAFW